MPSAVVLEDSNKLAAIVPLPLATFELAFDWLSQAVQTGVENELLARLVGAIDAVGVSTSALAVSLKVVVGVSDVEAAERATALESGRAHHVVTREVPRPLHSGVCQPWGKSPVSVGLRMLPKTSIVSLPAVQVTSGIKNSDWLFILGYSQEPRYG